MQKYSDALIILNLACKVHAEYKVQSSLPITCRTWKHWFAAGAFQADLYDYSSGIFRDRLFKEGFGLRSNVWGIFLLLL